MGFRNKVAICIFIMFASNTYAQTYPKYTTTKTKATAPVKKEKHVEAEVKARPVQRAEEQPEEKQAVISAGFNDLFSKAAHLYKEKKFDEAAKTYTEALAIAPDEWKYLVLQSRGYAYLGMNDYNKAISDCTTAIEKTKVHNKIALGHLYFVRSMAYKDRKQGGDMERACADYKVARETGFSRWMDVPGYDCK